MIIWLASYPRSGNSLSQVFLKGSFGLQTYQAHPPLAVAHFAEYLDAESLSEAAAASQTYFVKTHDPPPDRAKAIYIVRDGRSAVISYFHFLQHFASEHKFSVEDVIMGECCNCLGKQTWSL